MMSRGPRLRSNEQGMGAVEFALIMPVLLLAIVGMGQLGILMFARAGLSHAVGEAARYASLYPKPTADQIKAKITSTQFGLNPTYLTTPTVTTGTSDSADYFDISVSYSVPLNFLLVNVPAITLTESRRVYTYATS